MADKQKKAEQEINPEQEINSEQDKPVEEVKNNNPFSSQCEYESKEICENIQEAENIETDIQSELETMKNQYLRLAADFDNYRKRYAQERESLLKYGAEETLKLLLPVLDTFDRAEKSIVELDDPEKIKESFAVVKKHLIESLEKSGLQKIDTIGKEFDPVYHEAVMQTPTNEHPNHSIIAELQSGYKLSDRVLRPALVEVAVNE